MHGTVMMFLFAIPMFEGLAIYLLPKMLGARDMAFPRLSAYGFWCYLFGGSILIAALVLGVAPDGGWFMYTPLSSRTYSPGINADVWLIGITFVEISAMSRRDRDHRHDPQAARAGHVARPDAAVRLVPAGHRAS